MSSEKITRIFHDDTAELSILNGLLGKTIFIASRLESDWIIISLIFFYQSQENHQSPIMYIHSHTHIQTWNLNEFYFNRICIQK